MNQLGIQANQMNVVKATQQISFNF